MEFTTLGWQGFTFEVPKSWILVGEKGSFTHGVLQLGDGIFPRFKIKWSSSASNLSKLTKEYESSLRKTYKNITILRKWKKCIMEHESVLFHWESIPAEGFAGMWNCYRSNRNVILEFSFRTEEFWRYLSLFVRTIGSVRCHSTDQLILWRIAGIQALLPIHYELNERAFTPNHTYLRFKAPKAFLDIDIYPLPQEGWEKYKTVVAWFEEKLKNEFKRRYDVNERVNSEIQVFEDGFIIRQLYFAGSIIKRKLRIDSRIWPLPRMNKFYIVTIVRDESIEVDGEEELKGILTSAEPDKL